MLRPPLQGVRLGSLGAVNQVWDVDKEGIGRDLTWWGAAEIDENLFKASKKSDVETNYWVVKGDGSGWRVRSLEPDDKDAEKVARNFLSFFGRIMNFFLLW